MSDRHVLQFRSVQPLPGDEDSPTCEIRDRSDGYRCPRSAEARLTYEVRLVDRAVNVTVHLCGWHAQQEAAHHGA
jgi:hypothetical protein